jgi:predicted nucleic acid-binding protein
VNSFLAGTGIEIDFDFPQPLWLEAGRRFARCAKRRPTISREAPKRLPADFIIGFHALSRADRFMTLDRKRYKQDFPDLTLI